jgi:DNA-binding CsgD family transcriptional regulator
VTNLLARLSSGEAEILRRIASGEATTAVALALGSTEQTMRQQLDLIRTKLVANDHTRQVIEAAQSNIVLTLIRQGLTTRLASELEYVTKEEFTAFKESVSQRLKVAS